MNLSCTNISLKIKLSSFDNLISEFCEFTKYQSCVSNLAQCEALSTWSVKPALTQQHGSFKGEDEVVPRKFCPLVILC